MQRQDTTVNAYSDFATGRTVCGSVPSRTTNFPAFPEFPHWLWGTPSTKGSLPVGTMAIACGPLPST